MGNYESNQNTKLIIKTRKEILLEIENYNGPFDFSDLIKINNNPYRKEYFTVEFVNDKPILEIMVYQGRRSHYEVE